MNSQVLQTKLFSYILKSNYINITTRIDKEEKINCIPISASDNLLLLLRFYDFMPDGYEILCLADIEFIEYSESCRYFENIVKAEGATSLLNDVPRVEIDNWETVFRTFKNLKSIIVVDIGKEECVNIGRVTNVTNNEVSMLCFSPTGIWDEEEWIEPINNITGIKFHNHYTNTFSKYLN